MEAGEGPVLEYWGAALSHLGAAYLWRLLPLRDGPVDISIPGNGGKARRRGIRAHRCHSLLPIDVTLRSGIPVTTPVRTIADLRRSAAGRDQLIRPKELRRAIRQANALGLAIDAESWRDRTRSDLERDFLRLCRRHRLPPPEVNQRVGPYLVDFLWRDRLLVVETDGYAYHRGRTAFEDDRARDLALRGLGFEVLRIADRQVDAEATWIAGVLRARLGGSAPTGPETRHVAP
jgi:very-short-patch-repair endonuclease